MMAMDTVLDANGCSYKMPVGTADEVAALDASYEHLCKMRDELVRSTLFLPYLNGTKSILTSNL